MIRSAFRMSSVRDGLKSHRLISTPCRVVCEVFNNCASSRNCVLPHCTTRRVKPLSYRACIASSASTLDKRASNGAVAPTVTNADLADMRPRLAGFEFAQRFVSFVRHRDGRRTKKYVLVFWEVAHNTC